MSKQQIVEELNLNILNGRTRKDCNGEFRYIGPNVAGTIDLCFTNPITSRQIDSFYVGDQILSSHRPLVLQLNKMEAISEQLNERRLKWNPTKTLAYQSNLSTEKHKCLEDLKREIHRAAYTTGLTQRLTRTQKNPWYDMECKMMKENVNLSLKQSRRNGSPPELMPEYNKLRQKFKVLIRNKKTAYHDRIRETINSTRNPSLFWNAIKTLRPRHAVSNPVPNQKWKSFYEDIMQTKSSRAKYEGTYNKELDKEITFDELKCALDKAKTGKAAGPDGIPVEFYKNLNAERKSELRRILNFILDRETIPEDWATSTTVMLFKKCDPLDPISYRPITLLNASMKIFMRILTARLTKWAAKYKV
jgi:hypothetical protein